MNKYKLPICAILALIVGIIAGCTVPDYVGPRNDAMKKTIGKTVMNAAYTNKNSPDITIIFTDGSLLKISNSYIPDIAFESPAK